MSSIDFSDAQWRKSSHSNGQANCVETAATGKAAVSSRYGTAKRQTAQS